MYGEREVKVIAYALLIAGLVCLAGLLLSGGCGRTGADTAGCNGKSTTQQVERAEELNRQAGAEIGTAGDAVGRAEQHAERAAELNQSAQTRVSDCQKLIGELKADNRRAKQLLDELIGEHQAGEATDAAH